jgi:hypothetical protein
VLSTAQATPVMVVDPFMTVRVLHNVKREIANYPLRKPGTSKNPANAKY